MRAQMQAARRMQAPLGSIRASSIPLCKGCYSAEGQTSSSRSLGELEDCYDRQIADRVERPRSSAVGAVDRLLLRQL